MNHGKTQPQTLRIAGPAGELESLWLAPTSQPAMAAIVCHPLPTAGGTMYNKVVHIMAQTFAISGMGVMRFNTRGTGTSAGNFDHGMGETEDLASVIEYLQLEGIKQFWLAGFSFGSFLVFRCVTMHPELLPQIEHVIMVGPPVGKFDYHISTKLPFPVTLLQGEADEVVESQQVFAWAKQVSRWVPSLELLRFTGCSHFFHGRLIELRQRLTGQLALSHPQLFSQT